MNPLFRIDFSISDSLKIVRKSVLIYETIIVTPYYSLTIFGNAERNGQGYLRHPEGLRNHQS